MNRKKEQKIEKKKRNSEIKIEKKGEGGWGKEGGKS